MDESQNPASAEALPDPDPDPDPEIEALLDFVPVIRKCRRSDGWLAEQRRGFIAALARLGSPWRAAQEVGRTESGAYKCRTAAGGDSFAAAWDAALALFHSRHPKVLKGRPSRGEIVGGVGRKPWPDAAPAPPPEPPADPETEYQEFVDTILYKYLLKLDAERRARLEGRTVEADFIVRQLTWLEVALDLSEQGIDLLKKLERGDVSVLNIVATPVSLLIDRVRRAYWEEKDEPERPPLAPLGRSEGEVSTGEPMHDEYNSVRDGPDRNAHRRREAEKAAIRAEAQRLWEEKAKAEAEEWAKRSAESKTNDA